MFLMKVLLFSCSLLGDIWNIKNILYFMAYEKGKKRKGKEQSGTLSMCYSCTQLSSIFNFYCERLMLLLFIRVSGTLKLLSPSLFSTLVVMYSKWCKVYCDGLNFWSLKKGKKTLHSTSSKIFFSVHKSCFVVSQNCLNKVQTDPSFKGEEEDIYWYLLTIFSQACTHQM